MVPYDHDIDIYVDASVWGTPVMEEFLRVMNESHGFTHWFRDGGAKLWLLYSKANWNGLDIWPAYTTSDGFVHIDMDGNVDMPLDVIYPLKRVNFSGFETYLPSKPEVYCDLQYGKGGWVQELSCSKHGGSGRNCVT